MTIILAINPDRQSVIVYARLRYRAPLGSQQPVFSNSSFIVLFNTIKDLNMTTNDRY